MQGGEGVGGVHSTDNMQDNITCIREGTLLGLILLKEQCIWALPKG